MKSYGEYADSILLGAFLTWMQEEKLHIPITEEGREKLIEEWLNYKRQERKRLNDDRET